MQREIDLFGTAERVGFSNMYALTCEHDEFVAAGVGPVRVSKNKATGKVHALAAPGFASVQFHPESVLTRGGPRIVGTALADVSACTSSMAGRSFLRTLASRGTAL